MLIKRGDIEVFALVSCAICKQPFWLRGGYHKDKVEDRAINRSDFSYILCIEGWKKHRNHWVCGRCAFRIAFTFKAAQCIHPGFGQLILSAEVTCAKCDNDTTIWCGPLWDYDNIVAYLSEMKWERSSDGYVCNKCIRMAELKEETHALFRMLTSAA